MQIETTEVGLEYAYHLSNCPVEGGADARCVVGSDFGVEALRARLKLTPDVITSVAADTFAAQMDLYPCEARAAVGELSFHHGLEFTSRVLAECDVVISVDDDLRGRFLAVVVQSALPPGNERATALYLVRI